MKKIILILFFIGSYFCGFSQDVSYLCTYGFTFDISQQKNWGYQKPIILSVTPGSSADKAGIRPYDIIEKIDDNLTENVPLNNVHEWMHDVYKDQVTLTISNLGGMKNVVVNKSCTFSHVIPEKEMASSFAFYSLENIQKRSFTCPFTTSTDTTLNLLDYRTFGFVKQNENYIALENVISESLRMHLAEKGLIFQSYNPDIIIQTYYSYIPNPDYNQRNNDDLIGANRYNLNTKRMQELPIVDVFFNSSRQAPFILTLGLQFIDRKKSTTNNPVIIWECEATEYLKSNYTLEEYARFHIPLMLVQFPFIQTKDVAKFAYNSYKYNYTGINYNLNNREHIIDVDIDSPADRVGIKRGDIIRKINNIPMIANPKDVEDRYRLFIFNTMALRDTTTQFMNSYGFARAAHWDETKQLEIAEAFKHKDYFNTFSYLFFWEPYINPTKKNMVAFDLKRGRKRMKVDVRPEIRHEESLELIK